MAPTPPLNLNAISELADELRRFAEDRDWEHYHTPKNLAMALAGEVGELLAEFQWMTAEESLALTSDQHAAITSEVADIFIYLVRLADVVGIDLLNAAARKHAENNVRFPVSTFNRAESDRTTTLTQPRSRKPLGHNDNEHERGSETQDLGTNTSASDPDVNTRTSNDASQEFPPDVDSPSPESLPGSVPPISVSDRVRRTEGSERYSEQGLRAWQALIDLVDDGLHPAVAKQLDATRKDFLSSSQVKKLLASHPDLPHVILDARLLATKHIISMTATNIDNLPTTLSNLIRLHSNNPTTHPPRFGDRLRLSKAVSWARHDGPDFIFICTKA